MTMPAMPPGGERDPRNAMRRNARYEEDDELETGSQRRSYENPTSAGMIGFIAAALSVGLLAVVLVLFIFLKSDDQQHLERTRLLYYWFLLLDVLSFFAGLFATILGARGSSPTNPLYRGYAVAALVIGIIEMVITVLFAMWMTCAVLLVGL